MSAPDPAIVMAEGTIEGFAAVGSIGCATMCSAESSGDNVLAIAKSESGKMLGDTLIVLDDQDSKLFVKPIDLSR